MQLGAFGIYKNIIKWDYPAIESINSILPAVDIFVCNIGVSEDKTKELMYDTFGGNKKVILFEEEWEDKSLGTTFFSSQTNKALDRVDTTWAFYLQSDEVIHEKDLPKIPKWMDRADREGAQAITFNYNHFALDKDHVRKTYKDGYDAYDSEIRLIKNDGRLISFSDAQSFCSLEDYGDPRGPQPFMHRPEFIIESDMEVFHYSYLRDEKKLLEKKKYLQEFYNVSEPSRQESIIETEGKYKIDSDTLKEFTKSHPAVMKERLGL